MPLPAFDTAAYGKWVLSVAVAVKTGYLPANQLKVWVQNVAVDPSNPKLVFAEDGPSVTITASPASPHLVTRDSTSALGGQARLMLQWTQGASAFNPPTTPVARTESERVAHAEAQVEAALDLTEACPPALA